MNPTDLPPGLTFHENGTFTGAPAAVGVYSFEVVVTDAHGSTATGIVSVTINPEIHPAAEQFTRLSIGPTLILGGKLHLRDPSSPTVRSSASPHDDFESFEEVDLSGVRVSVGVTFRR